MHPLPTASPRALLAALRPQALGPALLSEAAWGRLDAVLARLPDRLGTLYLELRLSGELDRADLMIHVGRHPAPDLVELAAALASSGPLLQPLAQLLRQASTSGDPLAEALQGAWLEWDLPEGTDARNEAPQLFVSGSADPVNGQRGGGHPALLAALAGLAGRPGAEADADRLSAAQALLPEGGRLVHLGCMTGRPERTLRGVFQVPEAALGPWLHAAGWPGPVATLPERLGGRVHARRGRLKVDLDLHNGPSARLGVFSELSASGARGHAQAPALLARLVADGLARPDRAAALLAWPGLIPVAVADRRCVLERRLDLKLVLQATGALEAKAYLGLQLRPSAWA